MSYSILQPVMRGGMLLAPLADVGDEQGWTEGVRFSTPPATPVVAKIRPGYESAEAREYLGVPPIMSDRLAALVVECGVTDIDLYDAVLRGKDGMTIPGYKAFNLVGLVPQANMRATRRKMFRLEENTSAIAIHDSVREAIEAAKIPNILFVDPKDWVG